MARPGPAYWESLYGIGSFQEFYDRLEPVLPDSVGYLVHIKDTQLARLAYESPLSGVGNAMSAILTAQDLLGADDPRTADTARRQYGTLNKQGDEFMAPLVIPGVVRVALLGQSGGQPVVNVFGVRNSGNQPMGQVASAVRARIVAAAGPISQLHPNYTLPIVRVMDLSSADGAIAEASGTAAGTLNVPSLSTNAASALVKWNGATRSGSSRGRLYFGPLAEAQINTDGRTLASQYVTSIKNAWQTVVDGLISDGIPMCVISRKRLDATNVQSVAVETVIATQRRRIRD